MHWSSIYCVVHRVDDREGAKCGYRLWCGCREIGVVFCVDVGNAVSSLVWMSGLAGVRRAGIAAAEKVLEAVQIDWGGK